MKKLIERIVQLRNPDFQFAPEVSTGLLLRIVWQHGWGQLRALRLLAYGKRPWGRFLGKGVSILQGKQVELGKWVKIGAHCQLSAFGAGKLQIGDSSGIGAFSRLALSTDLSNPGSHITLGQHVGIGEYAYLGGAGGLEIGDGCIIGQYFSCHPENHVFDSLDQPIRLQGVVRKGIRIGKGCWIGAKVTVLDGVEIGDNCVIAAGAVVTKSMPSGSIVGGVPARIIRSRYPIVSNSNIAL